MPATLHSWKTSTSASRDIRPEVGVLPASPSLTWFEAVENTSRLFFVSYYCCYFSQKGDATSSKEETQLPEGWAWEDEWQIDLNRAVDEEGVYKRNIHVVFKNTC